MSGFGLLNVNLDAKQWEPIAIIGLAGVAGYFLYIHLQARNQQTQAANDFNTAEAPAQSQYQGLLQLAGLQTVLSALGLSSAPASSTASTSTGTSSATPNPGQAYYSAPTPTPRGTTAATASTTSVGSDNPGSV